MSSVDDDTLMEVLTESEEPGLTTTEVASEVPLARGTVRSRLQALADEGRLDREREGRDVVWFLPERADESSPASGSESGSDDGGEEEQEETTEPATRPVGEEPGDDEGDDGEPAAGSTAAVTEQGETVPTATDPASATATGSSVARPDENTLVRAAIAGILLAVVYYAVRRIRGES